MLKAKATDEEDEAEFFPQAESESEKEPTKYSNICDNKKWDQRARKNLKKEGQMFQEKRDTKKHTKQKLTLKQPRDFLKKKTGVGHIKPRRAEIAKKLDHVQLETAPVGTFPVFKKDGTFPGICSLFSHHSN